MREKKQKIRWRCPHCRHKHRWRWDKYDTLPGKITMECEGCGTDTRMTLAREHGRKWRAR